MVTDSLFIPLCLYRDVFAKNGTHYKSFADMARAHNAIFPGFYTEEGI